MNDQHSEILTEILLKRFDTYITEINTKSTFLIIFNTFILGALVLKLSDVSSLFSHPKINILLPFIVFVVFVGATMSLFFAFKATRPILESGNKTADYHSLIFFGSVAQMEQQTFLKRLEEQTKSSMLEDIARQGHILATCCQKKHLAIKKSIDAVLYGVLIPIAILASLKIIEYFITP